MYRFCCYLWKILSSAVEVSDIVTCSFPEKNNIRRRARIKARAQYGQSDLNGTSKDNLIMSGTMDLLVFGQHFVKTPKKSIVFVMNLKKIKIPDP